MKLSKAFLRLLVALPFFYQGLEAAVHCEKHARLAGRHWSWAEKLGLPPLPFEDLKNLARLSGLATAWLAWRLLRGKTPRLSILGLTVVNFSSAAVQSYQATAEGEPELDLSRISAATGLEAGLLSLLKHPTA